MLLPSKKISVDIVNMHIEENPLSPLPVKYAHCEE